MGTYPDEREWHDYWSLAECLRVLYRRKGTVVLLTLLAVLIAAALTARQPRVYRAHASLEVQAFNDTFLDLRDVYPAATPSADAAIYLQTQAEMLLEDGLLQQVAQKLHLDRRPEFQGSRGVVPRLRQDISIVPVRNSRILQIVCDARSPVLAAGLANTVAETFIQQSIQNRRDAAWQTYQELQPQLSEMRRALHPSPAETKGAAAPSTGDVNRRVYDTMLQKSDQAWVASRLATSNIRLAGAAEPPLTPHRPNLPLNLAIGSLAGILLGVACVMLQEQHRSVLRVPGDAGTWLALPELGAIPQASNWPSALRLRSWGDSALGVERATLEQRPGVSESFRATVASLLSAGSNGGQHRLIVVTSSQPMEGKTTVVSNLGIALAAISKKVLLIDGDMRRPRLHKLFDEANSWGLSDVLREKNAIDDLPLDVLAKKTSIPHLYLLPSGASTDNIFGLLYSGRLSRLLPLFRAEFDYVLVDAPPCLEFADARIMGRYAEELLLVVRADYTDRRTARAAVQRLRLDGIPLMGVILNRYNSSPGDPYPYRYSNTFGRQVVS